ncbi:uncharacterized protein LOC135831886 [Planococcus citri]|uniref:uncharacterized protein LOC135831886 n=1 Tax=Planococcus citri TaxID=170843 RepID=UPI0031F939DC
MPILYTFCSWFSVRMGSVIVGSLSLIQGVVLLLLGIVGYQNHELISFIFETIVEENDMLFAESYFIYLHEKTEQILLVFSISQAVYVVSCILLIIGSYKLNIQEIIPFTVLEFIRLILLTLLSVTVMLLIKKNVLDFNVLIACIVISGFILLFLYYLWLCPVSLIQCILRINTKKKEVPKMIFNKDHLSLYYDYLSDFKFKPVMPNRDYYQYQYGNLPKLHV